MTLDSVYDSIRKREIERNLEIIKSALFSMENYASGYRIVGDAVEEIADVARRLQRLAAPSVAAIPADLPAKPEKVRDAA